jgi:type III secretion protein R
MRRLVGFAALGVATLLPSVADAAPIALREDDLLGRPLALVVALALVSLLPFVFMSVTSFVKISTVLQIVRGAIGAQSVPSSTVIMALAAALTVLAMAPVGQKIADRAAPLFAAKDTPDTLVLVERGIDAFREPIREFLAHNASPREKERFLTVARTARPEPDRASVQADNLTVLIPAFVVTELSEAFAIGFLIYLPFLVIDLVVANILLALGMQMLSPTQVSLPFKLLLFVSISGWGLLAQGLASGYH